MTCGVAEALDVGAVGEFSPPHASTNGNVSKARAPSHRVTECRWIIRVILAAHANLNALIE